MANTYVNLDEKITNKDLFITNFKRFQEEFENNYVVVRDGRVFSYTNYSQGDNWAEIVANFSIKQINFFLEEIESPF